MGWKDGEGVGQLECRMSIKGEWEIKLGGQVRGQAAEGLESNHEILYSLQRTGVWTLLTYGNVYLEKK